ncbi:phage major capsid protein [Canibacter sp. lx-45]|nr:phage major capsid protein [Canibacter zhuwentaonis]
MKQSRVSGGDWSKIIWGSVDSISYEESRDASVPMPDGTQLLTFTHKMVAIRAEAEYGFRILDKKAFVKYLHPLKD